MIGRRLYRLRPWLIRALIPPGHAGSYVLYADVDHDLEPRYNGRSDHDLAGRLTVHAQAGRGDYFSYDVHRSAATAYLAECATFHLRPPAALNVIHPATPHRASVLCPFCSVRGLTRGLPVHPVVSELLPATQSKED